MLEPISDNIWSVPSPLAVFGFIQLNTRMTIIRMKDGRLFIHSPIPWSTELDTMVSELGEVAYIVAPSCFHHLFVGDWKVHHPNALMCGPKGLLKKRQDLQFDVEMTPDSSFPWASDIQTFSLAGMPIVQEYLFFHKDSRTLVVTDFMFYMPSSTGFTSFYAWINGVKSTLATPILFKSAVKDKPAFLQSLQPLKDLPVSNISLCHHHIIQEDAAEHLLAALAKWNV
jgi:hypothetical protein